MDKMRRVVDDAENAIREYRAKMRKMEEDMIYYKDRYTQNEEEMNQIKVDMQQVLQYKTDLEIMVEEQTQSITASSRRLLALEENIRYKDDELDKKEGVLRRTQESSAELKKKLM